MSSTPIRNVELELTLRCDRKCQHCNRRVGVFDYSDTDMTMEQVDKFCREVEKRKGTVKNISILGGEPLLHPQFEEVMAMVHDRLFWGRNRITVATNGDLLQRINPKAFDHAYIRVIHTKDKFVSVDVAPRDTGQQRTTCRIPRHCGIVCNVWGWWPCGQAQGICRLFSLREYQRMEMPECFEDFGPMDECGNWSMCNYCQWSAKHRVGASDRVSKSYARAYLEYQQREPFEWKRY